MNTATQGATAALRGDLNSSIHEDNLHSQTQQQNCLPLNVAFSVDVLCITCNEYQLRCFEYYLGFSVSNAKF